jgi:hypothetical protein
MTGTERNTCGSERPKYPPPPRSGNAFAAAVFAAIPGLLGFGAIKSRPRPIASPFGALPDPWSTPNPNQTPGFNVQPEQPAPNPMSSLLASFTPSRQDVADTLGAPVDALAWALHKMGVPISGDKFYGGNAFNRAPISGEPTWTPGPSVPFGSQYLRNAFDNPPNISADQLLRYLRRPGLF